MYNLGKLTQEEMESHTVLRWRVSNYQLQWKTPKSQWLDTKFLTHTKSDWGQAGISSNRRETGFLTLRHSQQSRRGKGSSQSGPARKRLYRAHCVSGTVLRLYNHSLSLHDNLQGRHYDHPVLQMQTLRNREFK